MNRIGKQEGFETAEYSEFELGIEDVQRTVKQIFVEMAKTNPAWSVWADMTGNQLKIHYHTYVMHLPTRMKQIQGQADDVFKAAIKELKAEFKRRTKTTLNIKEFKDRANYSIEKVSLNERYYYKAWRVFEVTI